MGYPADAGAAATAAASEDALASVHLRAGRTGASSHRAGGPAPAAALALGGPIPVPGWQAAVRVGLVQLVVGGDAAATAPSLSETLLLDRSRLFAA